jgi:hypothetical protein
MMATLSATFRQHRTDLEEADNAVMALLVGAQLASQNLKLVAKSNTLISSIFPGVRHINRFQLKPARAIRELESSEGHLSKIALPYAMSVHEDYMGKVKEDLLLLGIPVKLNGRAWNAENMHAILLESLGVTTLPDLTDFEVLRRLRNALIHNGGVADAYLKDGINQLSADATGRWIRSSGRPPGDAIKDDTVALSAEDVMVAFSVTRHLSSHIHDKTIVAFPRTYWIKDCVEDFSRNNKDTVAQGRLLRTKLERFAEQNYEDLAFSWPELKAAASTAGLPLLQLRKRGQRYP